MPGARAILGAATALAAAAIVLIPRVAQDPSYHDFADARMLLGIPHGLNVLSNLPFALVGALGLWTLRGRPHGARFREADERRPYAVLFAGVTLTAFGSAYYHLAPDDGRLVWDRLPMTLGFMGIFCATLGERVSVTLGRRLLGPALAVGLASVVYWWWTERAGAGDLRLYGAVQFYPMIAIPLMLALLPPAYTRESDLVLAMVLYAAAKFFEIADAPILSLGGIVSGHTLKHLAAAAAAHRILVMLKVRRRLGSLTPEGGPS